MTRPTSTPAAARRAAAFALALAFAGCHTGPVRPEGAVDPRTYSTCQDPDGAAAWARARAALARNDDAAALPDLRLCIERCPDLVRAHLAWQDTARRVGGEAERTMQQHYLGAPQGASVVVDYMRARLADTSYAQGNALTEILRRDPSFAWAHLSLARVTRRQGRLLPAIDMFAAAIVNDAQLYEARLERAQVLAELGREEEAALDYRAYLRGVPDDTAAMRAYVTLLLYRLGRIDEAMVLLDRLEQEDPRSTSLRMDRAAALWRAEEHREAAEQYLRVLAEQPDCARAALNIGYLYYEVLPTDEASRRRFWPAARAAFRLFLKNTQPADGHEQFERTLAVPYRLAVIEEMLGPDAGAQILLEDLAWPGG